MSPDSISAHLVTVVERLIQTVPELQPLYREHLADNFNKPISYVFVAEVAHFIAARSDDPAQHSLIKRVFRFFENELANEPKNAHDISDLIGAGFGEALEHETAALPVLLGMMPPRLRIMMNELKHAIAPELTFREARAKDIPKIVELLADDELGRGRENPEDLDRYSLIFGQIEGDVRNSIIVATNRVGEFDFVVGCFQITFITGLSRGGATRALIEGVRVDRQARGLGIGEAMMHHAIRMALDRGCALVQLTSDKSRTRAHEFYRRLGFKMSHEGFKLDL